MFLYTFVTEFPKVKLKIPPKKWELSLNLQEKHFKKRDKKIIYQEKDLHLKIQFSKKFLSSKALKKNKTSKIPWIKGPIIYKRQNLKVRILYLPFPSVEITV